MNDNLMKGKSNPIPLVPAKTKRSMTLILITVIGIYILAAKQTDADPLKIISGLPIAVEFVFTDLIPPNFSYYKTAGYRLLETWNIALLSTTLAAIFCLPFSFLAASNVNKNKYIYNFVRFMLNVLRHHPGINSSSYSSWCRWTRCTFGNRGIIHFFFRYFGKINK